MSVGTSNMVGQTTANWRKITTLKDKELCGVLLETFFWQKTCDFIHINYW